MDRVILQDIALRCGMSRGTVDRVGNGCAGVPTAAARTAPEESGCQIPTQRRQANAADLSVMIGGAADGIPPNRSGMCSPA